MQRLVILTEGHSNSFDAKTATGVLRYRPGDVVAVLDSTMAGKTCDEVFGVGGSAPIVASLDGIEADALLLGIAPPGGELPETWREVIRTAIRAGMDVVNGLHSFLRDDEEFAALAAEHGSQLFDVRDPPSGLTVGKDLVRSCRCHRVHTVGHDCAVGKMLVALEVDAGLRAAGRRSAFVATGQTGIMITGWGVPADRVVSDFVSGAVEEQILAHQDEDFLVVEGQGSLCHPLYSGVTLGLLHGCAPQTMVMVFEPGRDVVKSTTLPMVPLGEQIEAYERLAGFLCPSKFVAIAANTSRMSDSAARAVLSQTEEEFGLPTVDVVRDGADRIVAAILERDREISGDADA